MATFLHLLKRDSADMAAPVIEANRREPDARVTVVLLDGAAAPPLPAERRKPLFVMVTMLLLAALLPLLAASLVLLWLVDRLLPHLSPAAARWLGLRGVSATAD